MWSVYFGFVASYYMGWLGYDIVVSIIVHMGVIIIISVLLTQYSWTLEKKTHLHGYTGGN